MQCGTLDQTLEQKKDINGKTDEIEISAVYFIAVPMLTS